MVRLASLVVTAAVIGAGLVVYAEPPADPGDDPPILKKKGAPDIEAPAPKPDDDKDKAKNQDKDKKPADGPKPDAGAGQPDQPQPDPDEVLNRASKDMRRAEDRLTDKKLDDATRQAQDDALKDLDLLIDLNENAPQSKDDQDGGGKSDDSKSGGQKSDPSKSASQSGSSGSSSGSSGHSSGRRGGKGRGKGKRGRGQGGGSQPGAGGASGDKKASVDGSGKQPGDPNSKSPDGGNGGGGKNTPTLKDRNADLYKDVWGHLPETLRAEMNAYSNTKGFMPEYESLISKYYSTIAEEGRRKGD